jgi:NAD-dependent SIR2 family protein deacetylase
MSRMTLLLLVGTSLAVTITHLALAAAAGRDARIVRIEPSEDVGEQVPMLSLHTRAEEILPEACLLLGAR